MARPGSAASRYRCAWKSCPFASTDALAGFTLEYTCTHTHSQGNGQLRMRHATAQALKHQRAGRVCQVQLLDMGTLSLHRRQQSW